MSTKKQRRSENFKDRKKKKSTRIAYLVAIIAGAVILLVILFVILFNELFPPVNMEAMKKKERKPFEIYFSDFQERFLVAEKRFIFKEEDPVEQAKEIVKALLDGCGKRRPEEQGDLSCGCVVDRSNEIGGA